MSSEYIIGESKYRKRFGEFFPEQKTEHSFLPVFLSENKERINNHFVDASFLGWELIPSKDPFNLSFAEFQILSLNESEELIKIVFELCKDLINDAWTNGYRQIIICDKKIIFRTELNEPISAKKVEELAKKQNKACYVFSAPDTVEESVWAPVENGDAYPTIKLYLGPEQATEKGIVNNITPVCPDFDTGNPDYKIFDANILHQELQKFNPFELRVGTHLGCTYSYYLKEAKICIKDIEGNLNSHVCPIRLVRDWAGCAVLQASPKRTGYVGRDLLRALKVRLKIDFLANSTKILNVS
jgi:hypothetical protein